MVEAKSGSIVYISSVSGIKGFVNETAYCPGKHGQEGLMKVLSMEGKPYNIAVNTIAPGAPIKTAMSASNYPPELQARWVDPAMITLAFLYLAGLEAKTTTGHRLDAWQLSEAMRVAQKM
jgi:NAD(P)-dependent dehydrogenase (short-subunit alcohol dehydrogenase family)